MPRLTARKRMYYGTRSLVAGDEFEASEKHARLLELAQAARACGAMDDEEQEEQEPPEVVEPVKKRRYKRRDLTAED